MRGALNVGAVLLGLYLLWSGLGSAALSTDEQYSAVQARLPFGALWSELVRTDTHPPLDYLVRGLVVGRGSAFWMRAPSALAASGSLLLVWWWMRRRGWFGCTVVAISSVLPFFLLYGRTARMYAFLVLFGILVTWLSDAWLQRPTVRLSAGLFVVLALALFTDNTSVLLVAGTSAVAGLRRDRQPSPWLSPWRWSCRRSGPLAPLRKRPGRRCALSMSDRKLATSSC